MQILQEIFGKTADQKTTYLYTLINDKGIAIKITNLGGIITEISAPDREGNSENVCLGFSQLEDYFSPAYKKAMPYFGAIVGRYANRIAGAKFDIDGTTYIFPANNMGNTLHGGIEGFDKKIWAATAVEEENDVKLILNYKSIDGEESFPGNLDVSVTYTLNNNNELSISYAATTDKKTHINLTNHTYFNLSACKNNILDHEIEIDADNYTEVDENTIPTGEREHVAGSPMDFREPHKIGARIIEVEGKGYDHNYELNNYDGSLRWVAKAIDKVSGRKLDIYTTEPGMQLYTSNYLDGSLKNKNIIFTEQMGLCFETQHYPDSPNQPSFPSTLLNPGEVFESTTIYKFSILD